MENLTQELSSFESLDILSIRRTPISPKLQEIISDGSQLIKLQNPKQIAAGFRIHFAKYGANSCLEQLESVANEMPLMDYVSIGHFITNSIGNYTKQKYFLELAPRNNYAWLERARARNLIALNRINEALDLLNNLLEINSKGHADFCISMLWQLNEWERIVDLEQHASPNTFTAIACAKHSIQCLHLEDTTPITTYSVYNPYTINQIELQKAIFPKSYINLKPALGVPADRLPNAVFEQLSGSSRGILGAALAHIKVIEDFYHSKHDVCLVTESDAFLRRNFNPSLLMNTMQAGEYDFILCADRHQKTPTNDINFEKISPFKFTGRASGFDGYAITKRCAKEVLNYFEKPVYKEHIDGLIIAMLSKSDNISIGVANQPIFGQSDLATFSTRAKIELDY